MSAQLTDERLKSWLDTNQLGRERLCLAVLSLDRRFYDVKPRHPRGGPDGGRDLEAICKDNNGKAFGAVGFVNSANDSNTNRIQIRKKFALDLKRSLSEGEKLTGFVFFTNISLTVADKDKLLTSARVNGITIVDIYDRERIRIVLDSTDGFSIRYQYLGIPLSEAEQATFFTKWGSNIQQLIAQSFEYVEMRLSQIQFSLAGR